ncbi:MAG: hypothetical protein OSB67_07390 [Alphaproteobacteria bacterium]|jgi:hypothetical protein|nr:hypothetical protein [Alphaproteobacteria bacterium]
MAHQRIGAMITKKYRGLIDGNRIIMDIVFGVPRIPDTNYQDENVALNLGGTATR